MTCEMDLKLILKSSLSPERKAEKICEMMTWNKQELTEAIKEIGTDSDNQLSLLLNQFWGR